GATHPRTTGRPGRIWWLAPTRLPHPVPERQARTAGQFAARRTPSSRAAPRRWIEADARMCEPVALLSGELPGPVSFFRDRGRVDLGAVASEGEVPCVGSFTIHLQLEVQLGQVILDHRGLRERGGGALQRCPRLIELGLFDVGPSEAVEER